MEARESYRQKLFAESLASYGESTAGPHTKLSISLPTDLLDLVRASAEASGSSVSATIAAALRLAMATTEQAALDRALELDAEEDLAWAEAFLPITAKLWSELEW